MKNIIAVIASLILLAVILLPLFGAFTLSSYASQQDELIAKQESADFAKQYGSYIFLRDIDAIKSNLDSQYIDSKFEQQLSEVFSKIPNEVPTSTKFIGSKSYEVDNAKISDFNLEYEFSNQWFVGQITLKKLDDGKYIAAGFHFNKILNNNSLENVMQFKLSGQSLINYIVFSAAIFILVLNVYALAACIKTPIPKRKWLWIIFIIVGIGSLKFDWSNSTFIFFDQAINSKGITSYHVDFFKLPAIQFSQMLYQPFFIHFSVPLGAILFLIRRKKWLNKELPS